ncbi:SDR family NAD(P)-dependent oxidoreductase [Pseudalkalibacillus caeni]|uniref:SDR family oxidoreductase n=1 Tax=Exobacillus caeni TaxID=2574798 RepID=A0A5R9F468_9BACL|nr:SDR family oxidoreductase [Pseudalkalibacillus caeni]TLS36418.1 SDR family oxidoreductase [Pseudalkalibacillus caeni]
MPSKNFKNKNVVITGASSGIGERLAKDMAASGARVILLARSTEKLEKIKTEIMNQDCLEPYLYTLDVSEPTQIEVVFKEIFTKVKGVDILINNAGFGKFDHFIEADMEDIEAMFQVNVLGLMNCTKLVLPEMVKNGSGQIINIASQAGKIGTPKSSGYSASKHAVLGFSNSLRMELLKTGVHVMTVNPGPIRTNFFNIADESGSYVKNVEKFMLTPEKVSQEIIKGILRKKREVNLPRFMNLGSKIYQAAPGVVEKIGGRFFEMK